MLHLNIRSINANFENFKNLLEESKYIFNVICLSETWSTDKDFYENSLYHLDNYNAIHFQRNVNKRGGGVLIYLKKELTYKIRDNLSNSDCNGEFLTIEIINKFSKNYIITCCYRPPNGKVKNFNNHLNKIFDKAKCEKKGFFILGDVNLNCFNYNDNLDVRDFYNNTFQHGAIPLINRPTRVTTSTATLIDNIMTNSFFEASLQKGIIKTSISDHFPIYAAIILNKKCAKTPIKTKIAKRCFSERNINNFKAGLREVEWNFVDTDNTNLLFEYFSETFSKLYEKHFPLEEKFVKNKDLSSPWMTKGMKKSSKQKQKLYIKFLKHNTEASKIEYKNYKNLFEKLRKKSKQSYYSSLINQHKNNSGKIWQIMKEIIGKKKSKSDSLPKMLKCGEKSIHSQELIANEFNNFFTNVGPSLANKIPIHTFTISAKTSSKTILSIASFFIVLKVLVLLP